MSIPTNQLVYAGIWNATASYPQYYFVLSPIDSLCYINITPTTVVGGADPSVQPSAVWLLFPNVTGDITGVIAGTGITGGGTTGSVVINNAGVLSLDGATGSLTTKCGGYHKNSNQTISTAGTPSFVGITWNQSSYGDTTTISQNAPNSQSFTVNQRGIYTISIQLQYANIGATTLADPTLRIILNVNRGGNNATILTNTYDFPNNTPTNPTQSLSGSYELLAGDVLTFQSVQYLSSPNSFSINGQSAAPLDFDYNTFWSWVLVQPL